jgi:hypothetical protein
MLLNATFVLHAAIPLLALVLLVAAWARDWHWLQRVRIIALIGLACTSVILLWLTAQPPTPASPEPLALALMCFLVGWIVLRGSIVRPDQEPRILPPLIGAAAAIGAGMGAAALALLSRAPAAWLGLLGGPLGQLTLYALSALGGLFVRYALAGATILHLGLATCAWAFLTLRVATADSADLRGMLLLFVVTAGVGSGWTRGPSRQA